MKLRNKSTGKTVYITLSYEDEAVRIDNLEVASGEEWTLAKLNQEFEDE